MVKKRQPLPHHHLKDLLPAFLEDLQSVYEDRAEKKPDLVLKGWMEVIDPKWRSMTEAYSFEKGVIMINVKNAALYSLLVQHEGSKLLKMLQKKFPDNGIKSLKFRIG